MVVSAWHAAVAAWSLSHVAITYWKDSSGEYSIKAEYVLLEIDCTEELVFSFP